MNSDGMLSEPACSRTSVLVTVLPPDVQQVPKAAEVESVESPPLSGIGCPRLAAIKEIRQNTSLVAWSFHSTGHCQTLVEFGCDGGCFGDPAADLSIEQSRA